MNQMAVASQPTPPPPAVWRSLEQPLFPAPQRQPWWNSLTLWRDLAAAGVLATAITLAPQLALSPPETEAAFAMIRSTQREVPRTVALAGDGWLLPAICGRCRYRPTSAACYG